MTQIPVDITLLPHGEGLPLPDYATSGSVGADLSAAIDEDYVLPPMHRALVPTGIAIALPEGYEGQIRPRSGLALKHGISLVNSPGTIDSDYRGEIKVLLINLSNGPFIISRGMRIAQLVLAPITQATWNKVASLSVTTRGESGFGSTGIVKEFEKA